MASGVVQLAPPFVDVVRSRCSWFNPSRPSDQVMTIWSVASVPVGAPFAMSTLGPSARSERAPAMPSRVGRPRAGSMTPGETAGATSCSAPKWAAASVDLYMVSNEEPLRVAMPNTYTLPLLSVRTVQPSGWLLLPLSAAGATWRVVQVLPPSLETETLSGVGRAWPLELLRNDAQQT